MSVLATKHLWRALAIAFAVIFAYVTVLSKLANDWWTDENYSHGLLIPFVIGFILWIQRDKLASERQRPSLVLGGLAIGFALFALWAGVAGAELYTQRLSLLLIIAGLIIFFFGRRLLTMMFVPFVLLFLSIPIPAIIFNRIAFPLQLFASRCAVWSMSMIGIPVLRQGNIIELKPLNSFETRKLEVVEACSGIRSLMTLLTLAVVFAYFTRPRSDDPPRGSGAGGWFRSYSFWRAAILVGSAVPIAILTNAARVSGTGILSHYYGTQVADGFFHTFSGWVVYIVAFLLLFAAGWVLDRFRPSNVSRKTEESHHEVIIGKASNVVPVEGAE